jgi:hypothetical protein
MGPAVRPSLSFPGPRLGGTLRFAAAGWIAPDQFLVTYNVTDYNIDLRGVDVVVAGGHDAAGNLLPGVRLANVFDIAMRNPVAVKVSRLTPSATAAARASYRVTFSEPVTGVDVGDFRLTTTGLTGVRVAGVRRVTSRVFDVAVVTGSGVGTLRLRVRDNNSIRDLVGNRLGGPRIGDGDRAGELIRVFRNPLG